MKDRRNGIITAFVIALLTLGVGPSASASTTWSWKATGTVGLKTVCRGSTVPVSDHVCSYALPNAPQSKGTESVLVTFQNVSSKLLCFGVSLSSSYDAGLHSVCARSHATVRYQVSGSVQHFRQSNVSLFVTKGSKTQPIAPSTSSSTANFQISASTKS